MGMILVGTVGDGDNFVPEQSSMLKVLTDILLVADAGDFSVLVLLNLAGAFDTLDHGILLN